MKIVQGRRVAGVAWGGVGGQPLESRDALGPAHTVTRAGTKLDGSGCDVGTTEGDAGTRCAAREAMEGRLE